MFFNAALSSRSRNTGPVTRDHAALPNEEQNTLTTLNAGTGNLFLFFRSQIHQCF